jgi:NitT/TauT family transport system substrate-binding protein
LHSLGLGSVPLLALSVVISFVLSACSGTTGATQSSNGANASGSEKVSLRLGYFPNITHAAGVAGVESGIFARRLGPNVELRPLTFNAGPSAIEALFAGGLDATYIGPNPAINGYVRSRGEALRIVAGATSGGSFLVVRPDITTGSDLVGKRVASPQLGNTQDVALRRWLAAQGYPVSQTGQGQVEVAPQENPQIVEGFRSGQIAGAWVPEPWATRLVLENGAKILLDEGDLWPDRLYPTVILIVRTAYLNEHADVIERLLEGHVEATNYLNDKPIEAQRQVDSALRRLVGAGLSEEAMASAWSHMTFTTDPMRAATLKSAEDAASLGFVNLGQVDLERAFELAPLNRAITSVSQGGRG